MRISEVIEWWCWYWQKLLFYVVLLILIICFGILVKSAKNAPPRTEETRILSVGKLVNIRATGDFGIYNTELKFEDGSMLLVTYSFSREHNLRVGVKYKIWVSSFYGYRCKLIGGE